MKHILAFLLTPLLAVWMLVAQPVRAETTKNIQERLQTKLSKQEEQI